MKMLQGMEENRTSGFNMLVFLVKGHHEVFQILFTCILKHDGRHAVLSSNTSSCTSWLPLCY